MKKCKYCNGKGTVPVLPKVDKGFFGDYSFSHGKTVTQCPKCFGKGSK
jgi:DnaJ-class molecular chaperone